MSAVGYALLWDFDGTLVDSGELWRRSEYTFSMPASCPGTMRPAGGCWAATWSWRPM